MYLNVYEVQLIASERMKDAIREAERARLIRSAKGSRLSSRRRWPVALTLTSLSGILTGSRPSEPHCRSLSPTPNSTCECA